MEQVSAFDPSKVYNSNAAMKNLMLPHESGIPLALMVIHRWRGMMHNGQPSMSVHGVIAGSLE